MMGNKKLQVWLPLIFSLVLIIGMFMGYKLGNQDGGNKGFFASNKRSSLQEAVDLIRLRYVDSVRLDSLEGRAIQEMMSELDPHSVYLPPVDLKAANEDLAGNFEGIGVEFNVFNDTVNVVYVVTNSPSDKAGLQIGDKIVKVNGVLLAGKILEADSIKKYIRGERGSKATLQILRDGKSMDIPVTRGTIPVPSVDASYMIDKTTGYIRLNKFTDNSYEEFMQALEALQKEGMKDLVYDLRSNGGGFMNEAVEMADEFLGGDKLIVYTEGVNSKKREYRCRRPGLFETGKLVLIVDELSASATEVLAGALQDWCRATIIGRRTFGKGLVQEQYPLSDGSAIRLTIARYYTPLGRSIQRSYEKGRKVYMDDLWERYNSGEMLSLDSLKSHNTGKKFTTSCNDTLYGSDGITPNVFVPLDTSIAQQRIQKILREGGVSASVYYYYLQHRQQIGQYSSAGDFALRFDATQLWNGYVKYPGGSMAFETVTGKLKEQVQQRLKSLLARFRWRNNGMYQVLNNDDPVIRKALEVIAK
ncbi:MAG TPA: S41 family peptidase [Chitinophagaceae bacterium]|jgi:carboxyl-terminal processing protease|nr:S41 family peptidase [Chitinophagaceae bacterium]